jgi:hypothetical protein
MAYPIPPEQQQTLEHTHDCVRWSELVSFCPSYESEEWYQNQQKAWSALAEGGWRFSSPRCSHLEVVRLVMYHEEQAVVVTLEVPKELGFREIHTQLLRAAERWAKANDVAEPETQPRKI